MHDDRQRIEGRLDRVLRERLTPAVHRGHVHLDVAAWTAGTEPVAVHEGITAPFLPVRVGDRWGAPWQTVWFELRGTVPESHRGHIVEAIIDLGFARDRPGFSAEGLAYRPDGTPIKGLNPRNIWLRGAPPIRVRARSGRRHRRRGAGGLPDQPPDAPEP